MNNYKQTSGHCKSRATRYHPKAQLDNQYLHAFSALFPLGYEETETIATKAKQPKTKMNFHGTVRSVPQDFRVFFLCVLRSFFRDLTLLFGEFFIPASIRSTGAANEVVPQALASFLDTFHCIQNLTCRK